MAKTTKKTTAKQAPAAQGAAGGKKSMGAGLAVKKTAAKKAAVKKTTVKKSAAKKAASQKVVPKKAGATKKRTAAAKPTTRRISAADRRQMIAEAAYLRGESQGFLSNEREDWLLAESEVDALLAKAGVDVGD